MALRRRVKVAPRPPRDAEFEALLVFLRTHRGFDFDGYKRTSLMRRIDKRMSDVHVEGYGRYMDFLEVHPDEFSQLFNTILINVTAFFRDPEAWQCLDDKVLPSILAAKKKRDELIRVWSAGCSSGEEAYSIAMLLADHFGLDAFLDRVKVYATDIDEEALAEARAARYSARDVEGVSPERLKKYFELSGNHYAVRKELRRGVIFGRHDLLRDAPISRCDLLLCRNTMMYFGAEAQAKILERLCFALDDSGVLFLGKAEMLLTKTSLFTPLDLKRRMFVRAAHDRAPLPAPHASHELATATVEIAASFESAPVAQLAIDAAGVLRAANERARTILHLGARDIGRRVAELDVAYRTLELQAKIDDAYARRQPVEQHDVEWRAGTSTMSFDVFVTPHFSGTKPTGANVAFIDVTRFRGLQKELEKSSHEIESAYEELQSTTEELETTNEELQSTVEELETTNEELQSTNEELETMNEELQSTNEELQTINTEVRDRSDELTRLNVFLNGIVSSLHSGVIVVDADLKVHVWNVRVRELWGLDANDVTGKSFVTLDVGVDVQRLHAPLLAAITGRGEQEVVLEAHDRRGRRIRCHFRISPVPGADNRIWGAVMLIETTNAPTTTTAGRRAQKTETNGGRRRSAR